MPGDPLLKGRDWQTIKRYWRTGPGRNTPCARCGHPIDRTLQHPHRWSLHVGHIVPRWKARQLGWTKAQTNHLSNTQPEHRDCSIRDGAAAGGRLRRRPPRPQPITTQRW